MLSQLVIQAWSKKKVMIKYRHIEKKKYHPQSWKKVLEDMLLLRDKTKFKNQEKEGNGKKKEEILKVETETN